MSGELQDIRIIDRADLERFAAQRRLPEEVLTQLRARAKNEISTAPGASPCDQQLLCVFHLFFSVANRLRA